MGNFIKKVLLNKNLVTILAVVVLIILLFGMYTKRVDDKLQPISVPYAKVEIAGGMQITEDKIGTMKVSRSMVGDYILQKKGDIINKYCSQDAIIPQGSLFFTRNVVDKDQLPANIILDIEEGNVLYSLPVNVFTTYGNAIHTGNYIDLYIKAQVSVNVEKDALGRTKTTKLLYGKLLSNIKILSVRNSSGLAISGDDENEKPSFIIFQVPEEDYMLLKKAGFMKTYDIAMIPVPTNEGLKNEPAEYEVSSKEIKDWLNKQTQWGA